MGLRPDGGSISVHEEVKPLTVGCPQPGYQTVNRLFPVHKASIHTRQGLLLLAKGPIALLWEATVSATVSEMDEGGNTERERVYLDMVTS